MVYAEGSRKQVVSTSCRKLTLVMAASVQYCALFLMVNHIRGSTEMLINDVLRVKGAKHTSVPIDTYVCTYLDILKFN